MGGLTMPICETCLHRAVCGKYKATGGVNKCEHHAEERHGRWEDEYGGKYANPRYRCSVCKARALYDFEMDLLDNWKEVQALTPNCPKCGAKMDL